MKEKGLSKQSLQQPCGLLKSGVEMIGSDYSQLGFAAF